MNSWIADSEERLLTFVKEKHAFSTKDLRWSIEYNRCFVNNRVERHCSYRLKKGDKITLFAEKRPDIRFEANRILYEDEWLLAYDKPIHIDSPELAQRLNLFLVHRLDRDTSGVLLFAKDKTTAHSIEQLFLKRKIHKEYLAIVESKIEGSGVVKKPIQNRWAATYWESLKSNSSHSLLLCKPQTGRTHQIRMHLKAIGHPILGDYTYGNRDNLSLKNPIFRPMLHAANLFFIHPNTKKPIHVSANTPADFHDQL